MRWRVPPTHPRPPFQTGSARWGEQEQWVGRGRGRWCRALLGTYAILNLNSNPNPNPNSALSSNPNPSSSLGPRAHLTAHPPHTHLASPPSARSPARPAPFPSAPVHCRGPGRVGVRDPPPHGCGGGAYMDVLAACPAHPHAPAQPSATRTPRLWLWLRLRLSRALKASNKKPNPPQPRKVRTEQKRGESPRPSGGTRTPVHLDCSGGYETSPLMFTFTGKYPCVRTSCSRWPAPSAEA